MLCYGKDLYHFYSSAFLSYVSASVYFEAHVHIYLLVLNVSLACFNLILRNH